jgi:hypothetical protein
LPGAERLSSNGPASTFSYLAFALIGILLLHDLWVWMRQDERIPYSQLLELVTEERIAAHAEYLLSTLPCELSEVSYTQAERS